MKYTGENSEPKGISEILEDRKPGDKPRFFLHDELIAWLKDNLTISTYVTHSTDYGLGVKFGITQGIPVSMIINTKIMLDDTTISETVSHTPIGGISEAFKSINTVLEKIIYNVAELNKTIVILEEKIKELENKPL
jgi:hypothetical protein